MRLQKPERTAEIKSDSYAPNDRHPNVGQPLARAQRWIGRAERTFGLVVVVASIASARIRNSS